MAQRLSAAAGVAGAEIIHWLAPRYPTEAWPRSSCR
jgi:hypothetical protein